MALLRMLSFPIQRGSPSDTVASQGSLGLLGGKGARLILSVTLLYLPIYSILALGSWGTRGCRAAIGTQAGLDP